jgi:DNA-binding transcriptional regulator YiaG
MSDEYLSIAERWIQRYEAENPDIKRQVSQQAKYNRNAYYTEPTAMQSESRGYACLWNTLNDHSAELDPVVQSAIEVRRSLQLSQTRFSRCLGISVRTLRDWEQGRRQPSGAARTLLHWVAKHPDLFM